VSAVSSEPERTVCPCIRFQFDLWLAGIHVSRISLWHAAHSEGAFFSRWHAVQAAMSSGWISFARSFDSIPR
jgi:hypothetical protein